ncbi:MAG: tetratricopeptide repeat protein [Patescibacteria group bacterium]|nr:tetratricopeptide repeat protein [Patescibacteria group bacterium]
MKKDLKEKWFDRFFLSSIKPYLWIILVIIAVYSYSLTFGFVYFDDNLLILKNLFFIKNIANIITAFRQDVFFVLHLSQAYYRPLLTVSFILNAQFAGADPYYYHLVNIILHIIASCLVYLLFIKFKYNKQLAFLFSFIFAIHPAISQAVVWIPGRNDSLVAIFFLAGFIFFLDWIEEKKASQLIFHLLFFGFAVLTKEVGLILPVLCFWYYMIYRKERPVKLKNLFIGWLFTFGIWLFLRSIAFQYPEQTSLFARLSYIYSDFPALIVYFAKAIIPYPLSLVPVAADFELNILIGLILIIIIAIVLMFSSAKRIKLIAFGTGWFLLLLLPSIVSMTEFQHFFLEHRLYLSIIGLFMILLEIDFIKHLDLNKPIYLGAFLLISLTFSLITFNHISSFKDPLTFWLSSIRSSPHAVIAYKNLGAVYVDVYKEPERAEEAYKKALELSPREPYMHNNLGAIYFERGELERAEKEILLELQLGPYDDALYNLGLVYFNQKRYPEAEKEWLDTLEINPDYLSAYIGLALISEINRDMPKAESYYSIVKKKGYSEEEIFTTETAIKSVKKLRIGVESSLKEIN